MPVCKFAVLHDDVGIIESNGCVESTVVIGQYHTRIQNIEVAIERELLVVHVIQIIQEVGTNVLVLRIGR